MMFLKIICLSFAIVFSTSFSSCWVNFNVKKPDKSSKEETIGTIVSTIDEDIWAIYQGQNKQYWFGSNGQGVYHLDGKTIRQYTTKDGLADNQIRSIQGDKLGNIYFDTPKGVTKFDKQNWTTLEPIYDERNKWQLHPDDLWFKMSGNINGVYRYDGQSLYHLLFPKQDLEKAFNRPFEESPYSPYGIYSIYKDKKGNMWFGTLAAGVYRYDGVDFLWIAEKELTILDDDRVPGVRSIIEDKEGDFWLSNILHRYKTIENQGKKGIEYEKLEGIQPKAGSPTMNFPYFMSALTDNKNSDLWLLTYSEGVWRYDGEQFHHYPIKDGEKEVFLFSMYKDRQGTIWLGTQNAGVYQLHNDTFKKFEPLVAKNH